MSVGALPGAELILHDLLVRARAVNPRSPQDEIALWLQTKPPFADWFIRGEQVDLAVGDTRIPVTGFRIPEGAVGVLLDVANAVGSAADYPNVTFALMIDGAPVSGFASIIGPLTYSAQERWRVMQPLKSGQRVTWVATNTGATAVSSAQGFLSGWYWTLAHPPAARGVGAV